MRRRRTDPGSALGVAGYHYYPGRDRVLGWLAEAGLDVVEEAAETAPDADWGYRHFLLAKPAASSRTPSS